MEGSPSLACAHVRMCRNGFACKETSDAVHTARYAHPCRYGQGCTIAADSQHPRHVAHAATFKHPCRYGDACKKVGRDEAHDARYEHLCPQGLSCKQQQDVVHMMRYQHMCPEEASTGACTKLSKQDHKDAWVHHCVQQVQGKPCKLVDGDAKHQRRFLHSQCAPGNTSLPPIVNALQWKFVSVDKTTLQNPILQLKPAQQWLEAPYCEVTVSGKPKPGHLLGWEMDPNDPTRKTGNLVVTFGTHKEVYAAGSLNRSPKATTLRGPWDHPATCVWRCAEVTAAFTKIFLQKIGGTKATFFDAFNALSQHGVACFVIGGAVRDCVQGAPASSINDIDMSFGCSGAECLKILQASGKFSANDLELRASGLVRIGRGGLELEGKSIGGWNFDRVAFSGAPKSISVELHLESTYRDFSCNSLCYDPINHVVIDPTGMGLQDAISKQLRITSSNHARWFHGNPSKVIRYFHMRNKGYTAGDAATRTFIHYTITNSASVLLGDNSCQYVASKVPKSTVSTEDPKFVILLQALPWK